MSGRWLQGQLVEIPADWRHQLGVAARAYERATADAAAAMAGFGLAWRELARRQRHVLRLLGMPNSGRGSHRKLALNRRRRLLRRLM